jgi:PII-like signaling protein
MELEGCNLRFFMHSNARHKGKLLYEWLLEQARDEGLAGGSAFRAMAGFGRHGVLHEEAFFELAGDLPIRVEFVLRNEEAERLLAIVREADVSLVYMSSPATIGVLGGDDSKQE